MGRGADGRICKRRRGESDVNLTIDSVVRPTAIREGKGELAVLSAGKMPLNEEL